MTETPDEILGVIVGLMRELFDEYEGPIVRETTAFDIEKWDSLTHVQLIIYIENELGVTFNSTEIQGFTSLGDLVDAVVKIRSK